MKHCCCNKRFLGSRNPLAYKCEKVHSFYPAFPNVIPVHKSCTFKVSKYEEKLLIRNSKHRCGFAKSYGSYDSLPI